MGRVSCLTSQKLVRPNKKGPCGTRMDEVKVQTAIEHNIFGGMSAASNPGLGSCLPCAERSGHILAGMLLGALLDFIPSPHRLHRNSPRVSAGDCLVRRYHLRRGLRGVTSHWVDHLLLHLITRKAIDLSTILSEQYPLISNRR